MNDTTTIEAEQAAPERLANPVAIIRHELGGMEDQFRAALPAHIPAERFARVLMTAIQQTPELIEVDRRSLWNAAMKAAQDGLLPDGREGAMVVRWDSKRGKTASWQPMIAGIRKKVRNSGEIATWDVVAVHANDEFDYELGDAPFVKHKPTLGEPGPLVAVYSIVTLKTGEKSRDVMSIAAVREIRDRYSDGWKAFQAKKIKSTPWYTSEDEMAKKTVARRHAKVLPMSTDIDDLLRRDDELYSVDGAGAPAKSAGDRPKSLSDRLDLLATGGLPKAEAAEEAIDPETGEITDDAKVTESTKPDAEGSPSAASGQAAGEEGSLSKAASPAVRLSEDDKKLLRRYAEALGNTMAEKTLQRGSSAFLNDHPMTEGTPIYAAASAIFAAHQARIAGDSSPVDADEAVKKVLGT